MFDIEILPTIVRFHNNSFWIYTGKKDHHNCKQFLDGGYQSNLYKNRY
jgi:hypothetical protein